VFRIMRTVTLVYMQLLTERYMQFRMGGGAEAFEWQSEDCAEGKQKHTQTQYQKSEPGTGG